MANDQANVIIVRLIIGAFSFERENSIIRHSDHQQDQPTVHQDSDYEFTAFFSQDEFFLLAMIRRMLIKIIPEYSFQNINRILLQMQSSRQKMPCAYAKVCKSKNKTTNQQNKPELPVSPRSKRADNIYEELMNQLDLEESEYITNLCKKNEAKMKRVEAAKGTFQKNQGFQDITNLASNPSQRSIKNTLIESNTKNRTQMASNSSIKASQKEVVSQRKGESTKNMEISSQSSVSPSEKPLNRYFLNNLDQYIDKLNQNQSKQLESYRQKASLNKYQSQGQRQFRRTVEYAASKQKQSNKNREDVVSRGKYVKLLDKLHEELVEKQTLQYKLQCKDLKIGNMKSIIQSMYNEITVLKQKLDIEKQEKEKYTMMAEQFAYKVQNVRKSKEKHYIPNHQKRNSHIPSSTSHANDLDDFFNKTGFIGGKCANRIRHDFERTRDRQQVTTLKKKGMHRYKMSEIFMEGSESEQEKASIYRDSYL